MNTLERAYMDVQPKLYRYFLAQLYDREMAEDLTQDVFYTALKRLHTFRGEASLETWLFSIARFHLLNYIRSKKKDPILQEEWALQLARESTEEEWLAKEETRTILAFIQTLPSPPKEVMTLRLFGERSFAEIGQLLGKSETYARVTFHRTKQKMQQRLEE
ncbi:sigma-70 family RNA polymerase sigma factor [Savagea sp. SN6]|uniref:Sigma-70 family RNA polymerase sigma factor n=1 Tax=Savagea serpentis TaxID=2785297 RepID=A0A8J7KAR8_9BACL|nr:sigma-70 family RNA polymerase sigma factor [Savagea serpentis]MBF4499777.1 sigma-70 family RNA polymerase sigma factor [Savagea serpentis]